MYFQLTLFFLSLLGITFMIGRKLLMLQNGEILHKEEIVLEIPLYATELRHTAIKNIKKYSYMILVVVIRSYFRFLNFIKRKYEVIKIKIENIVHKNHDNTRETSRFLKVISEYKKKIREIKYKIKEEEENLK